MTGPSETDKAYAAGIVDGEGCIFVCVGSRASHRHKNGSLRHATSKRYQYGVRVRMVDHQAVKFLEQNFCGSVRVIHSPSMKATGRRPQFRWDIYQRKAQLFLEEILPYLKVKRDRAEMVIELARLISKGPTGRGYTLTEEQRKARNVIANRVMAENQRKARPEVVQ